MVSEFDDWVSALPKEMEASLTLGETVSTAYWTARKAGWDAETLKFDALAAVRRGAQVGALVGRLRTLSSTRPKGRAGGSGTRVPPPYEPSDRSTATPEQVKERVLLLRTIERERMDPDTAEAAMRALIAAQL